MITRVRLRNWRSHLDSELKFSKGVNTLLGIMGSGKSSVLDGICFALFGTFPALSQRKIKLDEIIRNKPEQAKKSMVELDFVKGNDVYTILRQFEFGKGTTGAELRKNGNLIETGNSQAVTEQVCNTLQTNYEIFSRAIYSEQNNIDAFLVMQRGKRMVQIDQLLGIDRFETARKNLKTLTNRLSNELKTNESISKDLFTDEDKKSLETLQNEKKTILNDVSSIENKLKVLLLKKSELSSKLKNLQEKENKLNALNSKKHELDGKISQIKETLSSISNTFLGLPKEELASKLNLLKEFLNEVESKKEKLNSLKVKQSSLLNKIDFLNQKISSAKEAVVNFSIESPIEELLNLSIPELSKLIPLSESEQKLKNDFDLLVEKFGTLDEIKNLIEEEKLKVNKLENEIEALKAREKYVAHIVQDLTSGNTCPVCKTKLETKRKEDVLNEQSTELDKIKSEQDLKANELNQAKNKLNSLENSLKELSEASEKLKSIEDEKKFNAKILAEKLSTFSELSSTIHETLSSQKKLESEINELELSLSSKDEQKIRGELEEIEKASEYNRLKEKLSNFEEEIASINKETELLSKDVEQLKEVEQEFNSLLVEEEHLSSSLDGLKSLISEKENRINELLKKKELLDKTVKNIEWAKETISNLQLFSNALVSTQESLREQFVENVNIVMDEVWGSLYPYDDLNSLKLVIESGDYVLKFHTANGWIDVEGIASGGERSLAALTLRIAFSLALAPNLSWLVLDEPTHNLDVKAIEELAVVLRDKLPLLIDQIFLITHEERLESAVSGYLYKLERDKEKDEPTKVFLISEPTQ